MERRSLVAATIPPSITKLQVEQLPSTNLDPQSARSFGLARTLHIFHGLYCAATLPRYLANLGSHVVKARVGGCAAKTIFHVTDEVLNFNSIFSPICS